MGGILGPTYGRMMNITLSPAGLYIRPKWSRRLFHPPVLLPWRCVRSTTERRTLFFRCLEAHCVAGDVTCWVRLPRAAAPIFRAEMAASRRER